ncbi:hypothetical protein [Sediminibacterium ginsengisoli]|uniref:DUF1735 domain-containing protein n=1 Tax=Sediminibacterium ginsengisoli TaxID=413434 RepID=A0A1T4K872_9BACT|nr:hypothetical protein [Sediminibacterium ginsengisoli]SJZ38515.1 hypothetical protein SAMN04488132_101520 [Sediminibacterium ginsengisoli]
MKYIKYSLLLFLVASLSSCLKSATDMAGLRTDKGTIVTAITEAQYLNTDAQNIGFGFNAFTNFSFATPATEEVKFFTLHVSQPRETKLSGPLLVKVAMTALSGFTAPPAGAITIPAEISVPASTANSFDFPVRFTVNKAGFNPALWYGATFTITAVNQGVYSELDKTVDIIFNGAAAFNNSRYTGRYKWTTTVSDPAGQYGYTNNTKPVNLEANSAGTLDILDFSAAALSSATTYRYLFAANLSTGASTALFAPRYVIDGTGKVTGILNQSGTTAVTGITLDASAPNQFTYTANDNRSMVVKYSFTLTTTIGGVVTPRVVTVTEKFEYDALQAYYP